MTHRIVVLGAGYAGLVAARRLARRTGKGVKVTLVNASDRFVERVRLHQVAAGQRLPDRPLRTLFPHGELVVDTVTGLDADARTVRTANGTVEYDTLVYALGSSTDAPAGAHTVATYDDAVRLRDALRNPTTVTVVGGGLTGIETAAELAAGHERLDVELVTAGVIAPGVGERGRRYLRERLARLGVTVHEGQTVEGVERDGLVVWTAGFRVPTIAADAGVTVDGDDRIVVDGWLRSVSHPDVYAIGDAAAATVSGGGRARMCCQTAIPMGVHTARVIAARLAGRTPRPVRLRYVWQNISLGRHDGLTQFVRADDRPLNALLAGRAAAAFKEIITRGAAAMVR